jgi:hypothetical protein
MRELMRRRRHSLRSKETILFRGNRQPTYVHSDGFVYFFLDGFGRIKIGWTKHDDLTKRAKQMMSGNSSGKLELVGSVPGPMSRERDYQKRWKHLRVEGTREWFIPNSDMWVWIDKLRGSFMMRPP